MTNLNELTIGEAKKLAEMFSGVIEKETIANAIDPLIGKYVIVRCHDAGVHAGILESRKGRECMLIEGRRLWYWKPAKGKWLSAVANHGLDDDSKVSEPVTRIALTENCEIIECSDAAMKSIRKIAANG